MRRDIASARKKLDARVKMLERDLASKRDAAHAYQGLVMSASSRPPAPVVQPMSVATEPSVNFPLGRRHGVRDDARRHGDAARHPGGDYCGGSAE